MSHEPIVTKKAIIVTVDKFIFGTKFYLRDKWLIMAKNKGLKLVFKTSEGITSCSYKEWLDGADKMKKTFNFPDNPMFLYGNYVGKFLERDKQKKEMLEKDPTDASALSALTNLNVAQLENMKEALKDKLPFH